VITIGIDPHKSSLTAVAVHPDGQSHAPIRLVVDKATPAALLAWASQWPERRDDLVAEHTRWINRLHVLLRDLLAPRSAWTPRTPRRS
jgi:hypothetical protein